MKTLRMLYTAALLSAAMLLAGCYSTDTDDDLLSTATLISIYPSTGLGRQRRRDPECGRHARPEVEAESGLVLFVQSAW